MSIRRFLRWPRRLLAVAASLGAATLLVVPVSAASAHSSAASADPSVCPFFAMAAVRFHPPIQSDEKAGYPMWFINGNPAAQSQGLLVHAQFPYAAWTAWSTYDLVNVFPHAVINDENIQPDQGSTNPFLVGNQILAPVRNFTLLVLPDNFDPSRLAPSLRSIPASNTMTFPAAGAALVERVYEPLLGYDRIGNAGPTHTPTPVAQTVSLTTGRPASCEPSNLVPPRLQRVPNTPVGNDSAPDGLGGGGGFGIGPGPNAPRSLYGPKPNPSLVEFFRPGLFDAPAPDVSSVPAPDNCAGYLTAKLNPRQIALVRVPKLPTYFKRSGVTSGSTYPQTNVAYVSFNTYGAAVGRYTPGSPDTMGLGNEDIHTDTTGGATFVVWPRNLTRVQQQAVFAYAQLHGWNLIRGNSDGRVYGDTLYIRNKGADPNYLGGYTPNANRPGAPCFRGGPNNPGLPDSVPYRAIGERWAATPSEMGSATPQGVECTTAGLLGGTCLARLIVHIKQTGGSYFAPPPTP